MQNLWSISLVLEASTGSGFDAWPLELIAAPTRDGVPSPAVALAAAKGSALVFAGRDFLHYRACCLPARQSALVLLLHYVPADFPTFQCDLYLDRGTLATHSAADTLRHECTALDSSIPAVEAVKTAAAAVAAAAAEAAAEATAGATAEAMVEATVGATLGAMRAAGDADVEELVCDATADAWLGSLHERSTAPVDGMGEAAASRGTSAGRYLLYNPCVMGHEPDYCLGQLNNQVHLLWHAIAVAKALQRTLVVPPFLWMSSQDAPQQLWFPASHFFDLCALRRRQPIVELHDFISLANRTSGGALSHYISLPSDDGQVYAPNSAFFTRRGLSFLRPRLFSPSAAAQQATSGRGIHAYEPGEGRGFWSAMALHVGRQQGELSDALSWRGGRAATSMLMRHARELEEWSALAGQHPELRGEPLLDDHIASLVPDALVLDYAPSYNFNLDCFDFDSELRAVHRALPFAPHLHRHAHQARHTTVGDARYLAAHLRRDGYGLYCAGSGLAHYGRRRFGVTVSAQMCFPSVAQVANALASLQRRHELDKVLLATNSIDPNELRELNEALPYVRWQPPLQLMRERPEWVASIELLLCAMATAFVGTLPSTFTTSILVQRDLLGQPRNTTSFWGAEDFFT